MEQPNPNRPSPAVEDCWAQWLLDRRFGGDQEQRVKALAHLEPIRDRVLDGAELRPGYTVLDVGCGDGLLGFAALQRTSPSGHVIFDDISPSLLNHCREVAHAAEVMERCGFVEAALPSLEGIPDACADAAVLRSVLIYVEDKQAAFLGLRRVLCSGGRLSLFEPINAFGYPEPDGWLWGLNVAGLEPLARRVHAAFAETTTNAEAMVGFDERTLLTAAQAAGFHELTLTYEAEVSRTNHWASGLDVTTFLKTAPNPLMPTYGQIIERALNPGDQQILIQHIGKELQLGSGRNRRAVCFMTGRIE